MFADSQRVMAFVNTWMNVPMRIALTLLFLLSGQSQAKDTYLLVAGSYSEARVNQDDNDENGFKLGVGYQIHPKWYLEAGLLSLASSFQPQAVPNTLLGADNFNAGLDVNGFYVAALGKARGSTGELFYRLGLASIAVEGETVHTNADECRLGSSGAFTVATGEGFVRCPFDESVAAGMVGLGYDFFLAQKWLLRTEIEHYRGGDDVQFNVVTLGLRYQF